MKQLNILFLISCIFLTASLGQPKAAITMQPGNATAHPVSANTSYSYDDSDVELTIPDTIGAQNQIIDIPIIISGLEISSISSIFMNISVDTNCLTPLDVIIEGSLTEGWQQSAININMGSMLFAMAGYTPLTENGVLVWLRYFINPTANENDSCTISIENVILNEGYPATIILSGVFRVQGLQLGGNVSYYGTQIPIPEVEFSLHGQMMQTTNSNNEGSYSYTSLHFGDYVLTPNKQGGQGDCITPFDAALILQHVVELTQLTPYQMIAADVTGDSTVSALDAATILNYSVGIIDQFPVMQDIQNFWRFVPEEFSINDTNWIQAPDSLAYTPLSTVQFNQNFIGVVYGDVSQNYQPSILKGIPAQSVAAQLTLGNIKKLNSSVIELPIMLDSFIDVVSILLEINYDATKMKLISIEKTNSSANFNLVYNIVDDVIKIAMAERHPEQIHGELLYLRFNPINNEDYHFELQKAIVNEQQLSLTTGASFRENLEPLPSNFELSQNYPNPFNNQTAINFALPVRGQVRVSIYNITGNHICTLIDEKRNAGYYTTIWNGEDDINNMAASGAYFVEMKINDTRLVRKILFIK